MRVLIVEDNPKTALSICKGLARHGIAADVSHSGVDGEELAAAGKYDLVLLDQMLPDRGGLEVCRNLRARHFETPIIVLAALSAADGEADGLRAGASDAITKPFSFEELLDRVRVFGHLGIAATHDPVRYGDIELDPRTRTVTRDGSRVVLARKEAVLLGFFMRNPNRVHSRNQIGQQVWGSAFEANSNIIEVYVSSLRRKLDRGHDAQLIHTIKGVGYRFGMAQTPPGD